MNERYQKLWAEWEKTMELAKTFAERRSLVETGTVLLEAWDRCICSAAELEIERKKLP